MPSFPQIALCFPGFALSPQPFQDTSFSYFSFSFSSGAGVVRPSLDYGEESDDELKQEDISFNETGAPPSSLPLTPAGRSISLDPGALAAGWSDPTKALE